MMAGRSSPSSQRRQVILDSAISLFSDWDLDVTCGNCEAQRRMAVGEIPLRHHDQTIAWMTRSLRCRLPNCGGRPSRLILRRGSYEVPLIGIGTYG